MRLKVSRLVFCSIFSIILGLSQVQLVKAEETKIPENSETIDETVIEDEVETHPGQLIYEDVLENKVLKSIYIEDLLPGTTVDNMPDGYVMACEGGMVGRVGLYYVPVIKQEYVTMNDPRQIRIQYVDNQTDELISEGIIETKSIGYITVYSGIGACGGINDSVSNQIPKGYYTLETSWPLVNDVATVHVQKETESMLMFSIKFISDEEVIIANRIGFEQYDLNGDKKITKSELIPLIPEGFLLADLGHYDDAFGFAEIYESNGVQSVACLPIYVVKDPDYGKPEIPFHDVYMTDWFYESVKYVYDNGLMTGLNETTFGPYENLARAQFAVILHRMNGSPDMEYTNKFPDVADNQWYTDAILWASDIGVVTGYEDTGKFGPGDNINREQMAVMMYRYANYLGYDTSARADISKYTDAGNVNEFAKEAMSWAVGEGIITGKYNETQLDPQGNASRAECATIIMRFVENYK